MIEAIDNFGIQYMFGSNSLFLDHLALTMTNALMWIPVVVALILLIIKNNDNMPMIGLTVGCGFLCVAMSLGVSEALVKPFVERLRPCNDPLVQYMAQIAGNMHSKDFSFYSSHASNCMALTTFFAFLVRSKRLAISMLVWSLIVCWTRVYLGQHFLTDVMVGFLAGIIIGTIGYLIYLLVRKQMTPRRSFISTQYTTSGYLYDDIDMVLSVMLLVLIYCMFPIF